MSFAPYACTITPTNFLSERIIQTEQERQRVADVKAKRADALARIQPAVELESDYLGMSSFYYNRDQNCIWEFNNMSGRFAVASPDVAAHLRELNHL